MEPWQYYLDQLQQRSERIPPHAFGRTELISEAAHDAYQATADHLTHMGWGEEDALTVTRIFGSAVKQWLANGNESWDALRVELDRRYAQWTSTDRTGV